jgi:fatty-acyl-CoA synthase
MAALVVDRGFDLQAFRRESARLLPPYARPLFLRRLSVLDSTGTFKPRIQELQRAGFDPAQVSDPLYFDDPRVGAYVPLDAALHAAITAGSIRL